MFQENLGVTETLQAMQAVKASWSGFRSLRILFNHLGIKLKLASEAKCKEALKGYEVRISYSEMPLASGKAKYK
jgi:hypothetical protein